MNKILCFLLLLRASFVLQAQITYPSTDFAIAGDSFRISKAKLDSLDGYNFQLTGANYTWNFSLLSPQSQYIDEYITTASSGYRLSFITSCIAGGTGAGACNNQWNTLSNLAHLLPDSLIFGPFKFSNQVQFFDKTTSALPETILGMSLGLDNITYPITVKYTVPDTIYHFPLAYGNADSCKSSYTINLDDIGLNFAYTVNTRRVNTVDGWGSLTTPYANFPSVLVLRSTIYGNDTMVYDSSVIPIPPDTMITYSWFATTRARPVLEVTGLVTNGTLYYTDVEYIDTIRCLPPLATFNYSPLDPYLGASTPSVSVSFNNTSNNANIFEWNFGDTMSIADTSTLTSPSHSYTSPGAFKVTLIACNSYCSPQQCDTTVLPVQVFDSTNVQANFTYLPLQPCTGDTVNFTNTSLNSTSWEWDFGDRTTSSLKSPQKTYSLPGNYTVTLIATGSGLSDTSQQVVTIGAPPVPVIMPPGNTTLCTGQTLVLAASGGQTYRWSNGFITDSITVRNSGIYLVTVYNSCGNAVSQPDTITMQSLVAPGIVVSSSADTVCPGSSVNFTASITNGGAEPAYQWMKNGVAVGVASPAYSYQSPANNDSVWCVLSSNANCLSTNVDTSNKVKILLKQQAVFSYSQSVCQGQGYNFNGQILIQNGTYYDTLTAYNGCDSIVTLNLTVKSNAASTITTSICAGSSYSFKGQSLMQGGTYYDTLIAYNGCDSIVTLNLTVKPNSASSIAASICAGSSYSFKGQSLTQAGTYYDTLTAYNGCDSIVTLNLTVKPNSASSIAASICAGSSYSFKGQSLTQAGTYYDTHTAYNGCDSIVTLNLTVKPNAASTITSSICAGSSYSFKGQSLTQVGTYYDTLTAYNGCDSIVTLNLTVNPNAASTIAASMCAGSSYPFKGQNLIQGGTYYDTLTAYNGCDSIVTLNLTVNPNAASTIAASICAGSSYPFKGQNLIQGGTYYDTLTSANGCDSIVTLNLTVKPNAAYTINAGVCTGNSYGFKGQNLTESGTYYDTLTSFNGCDSIITLNLMVNSILADTQNIALCAGQTFNFGGKSISQTGAYVDTFTAVGGCDSIVVVYLQVSPIYSDTINNSICQGSSYNFFGTSITAAGYYSDTLFSIHGCDSIITLHLTLKPQSSYTITDSICAGSSYPFKGQSLTQSGTYYDTLSSSNGCDSIITLNLQVKPVFSDSISSAICNGSSYLFNGLSLSLAGIYMDTLIAQDGCDSIVVLTLTVNPLPEVSLVISPDTICNNVGVINLAGDPPGGTYSGIGVSGSNFYPDSAGVGIHVITYSYADSLNCSAEVTDTILVTTCLGIDELGMENFVTIFPNPAQNNVTLQWQSSQQNDNLHFAIYDLLGREVVKGNIKGSAGQHQIDVSALSNGLYTLKLIYDNGSSISGKLAVSR